MTAIFLYLGIFVTKSSCRRLLSQRSMTSPSLLSASLHRSINLGDITTECNGLVTVYLSIGVTILRLELESCPSPQRAFNMGAKINSPRFEYMLKRISEA